VAVTLNGVRHDVNMTFPSLADSGSGIDVAFQEDLDGAPHNYTVWVDNVTLNER